MYAAEQFWKHPIFHERKFLLPAFVVSQVLLVLVAWNIYQIQSINDHTTRLASRMATLRGVIIHLDELLTMSARMAVISGDLDWETRYRRYEPQLNAAIKEALDLMSGIGSRQGAATTNAANLKLVAMEKKAFALLRAGERAAANKVLFSHEYKTRKTAYAQGMIQLSDSLRRAVATRIQTRDQRSRWTLIFLASLILLLLVYWFGVLHTLLASRRRLQANNHTLKGQSEELEKHRKHLDHRVAQRTKELDQSNAMLKANKDLLESIRSAQSRFIHQIDTKVVFKKLLEDVLVLTASQYGFIGEVLESREKQPYLKTHAITDISWNRETRLLYEKHALQGMEFYNLNSLFGMVMTSGKTVISNDPAHDPRRCGIPDGHPPLNAFFGDSHHPLQPPGGHDRYGQPIGGL